MQQIAANVVRPIKVLSGYRQGKEVASIYFVADGAGWFKRANPCDPDRDIHNHRYESTIDEIRWFDLKRTTTEENSPIAVMPIRPSSRTKFRVIKSGTSNSAVQIQGDLVCLLMPAFPNLNLRGDLVTFEATLVSNRVNGNLAPVFSRASLNLKTITNSNGKEFKKFFESTAKVRLKYASVVPWSTWSGDKFFSHAGLLVKTFVQLNFEFKTLSPSSLVYVPTFELRLGLLDSAGLCSLDKFGLAFAAKDLPKAKFAIGQREIRFRQRPPAAADLDEWLSSDTVQWIVETAFPFKAVFDRWNKAVCAPVTNSLVMAEGASGLSFIPRFVKSDGVFPDWIVSPYCSGSARYLVKYSANDLAHIVVDDFYVSTNSLWTTDEDPEVTHSVRVEFPKCSSIDGSPLSVDLLCQTANVSNEMRLPKGFFLQFQHGSSEQQTKRVRIGSLELDVVSVGASTNLTKVTDLTEVGPCVVQVASSIDDSTHDTTEIIKHLSISNCTFELGVQRVSPGQQDPIREDLYAGFRQQQNFDDNIKSSDDSIIIELSRSQDSSLELTHFDNPNYSFSATDRFVKGLDHTVDITLRQFSTSTSGIQGLNLLVIDRSPFFVSKVRYKNDLKDLTAGIANEIANFSTRTGSTWELSAGSHSFEIHLPPQGIGEAIEKSLGDADISENKSADCRFSPPAIMSVSGNYFDQRFAEVPWNLRRQLGYPGQRDPGLSLLAAKFEIFYGLTAKLANIPYLRLCEISARLGALPPALPSELAWQATESQAKTFKDFKTSWSAVQKAHDSRLAILEPWQQGNPTGVFKDGVSFELRKTADLRFPIINREDEAPDVPLSAKSPTGLAGGVGWIFDQLAFYNAIWKNPASSSGEVSGIYFSALGAWGTQVAKFDNDLTIITTEATMGRTHRIVLERIGRISQTWHLAKHVVIFERTVTASRQFAAQQDSLLGRAIIRKVKEYVELTTPTKRLDSEDSGEFLQAFSFPEGCRQINVDSAWGADIYSADLAPGPGLPNSPDTLIGWKVPLWKPGAYPSDVYPRPVINLTMEACDKSSCESSLPPEKFFFVSLTNLPPNYDPKNPLNWPRLPHIDTRCRPAATLDPLEPKPPTGKADFEDITKIAERAPKLVPPRLSNFTFRLDAINGAGVNLLASRNPSSLEAAINSVTLSRGTVEGEFNDLLLSTRAGVQDAIENSHGTLVNFIDSSRRSSTELATQLTIFKTELQTIAATVAALPSMIRDCSEVANLINKHASRADELVALLLTSFESNLVSLINKHSSDLDFQVTIANAIDAQFQNLSDFLFKKGFQVQSLFDSVDVFISTTTHRLSDTLSGLVDRLRTEIQAFPDTVTVPADTLQSLSDLASEMKEVIDSFKGNLEWLIQASNSVCLEWVGSDVNKLANKIGEVATDCRNDLVSLSMEIETVRTQIAAGYNLVEFKTIWLGDPAVPGNIGTLDKIQNRLTALLAGLSSEASNWQDGIRNTLVSGQQALTGYLTQLTNEKNRAIGKLQHATGNKDDIIANFEASLHDCFETTNEEWLSLRKTWVNLINDEAASICNMVRSDWNSLLQSFSRIATGAWIDDLIHQVTNETISIQVVRETVDAAYAQILDFIHSVDSGKKVVCNLEATVNKEVGLTLLRAFGTPPKVQGMDFLSSVERKGKVVVQNEIDYFFHKADEIVITPCAAAAALAKGDLEAIGLNVPTVSLTDRIKPLKLDEFHVNDIIEKFAGAQLAGFFPDLKMPSISTDSVKLTHGFDKGSYGGWMQADVAIPFGDKSLTMFDKFGAAVRLENAGFEAVCRIEASRGGQPKQSAHATIKADWLIEVGGLKVVTLVATEMYFDDTKKVRFNVSPNRLVLNGALEFLSDLVRTIGMSDDGFSIKVLPTGIQSILSIPLPDIQGGTFGISNLNLGFIAQLSMASGNFELLFRLWLASQDKPFTITVFLLGGAGWFDCTVAFVPTTLELRAKFSLGIAASASFAISVGPLKGGISAYFGLRVEYEVSTTGPSNLAFAIFVQFEGHVSICGIVSASICLSLEAQYSSTTGVLVGRGRVKLSIKICWCFTLKVDKSIEYKFGSPKKAHTLSGGPKKDYRAVAQDHVNMFT